VKFGSLVKLLEAFEPLPTPINLMYAGRGQIPLKLRVFIDFAVPRLRERLGLARAAGDSTPAPQECGVVTRTLKFPGDESLA
jgi:hypothetical protein